LNAFNFTIISDKPIEDFYRIAFRRFNQVPTKDAGQGGAIPAGKRRYTASARGAIPRRKHGKLGAVKSKSLYK